MPRGKPKKLITFRLDPDLIAEIDQVRGAKDRTSCLDEALRMWLRQHQRTGSKRMTPAR